LQNNSVPVALGSRRIFAGSYNLTYRSLEMSMAWRIRFALEAVPPKQSAFDPCPEIGIGAGELDDAPDLRLPKARWPKK
jgi:hypothetical protein